ncbi:MAG TPA: DUF3179 domain-containing protein [Sulfuricaulis sp.]|nr:DUF3179 domain-containing protein [Sulfuricaulis sp.]
MDSQLWSAVSTVARSRAWYYRLLRIALLSAVGWNGWQALRPLQAEEALDRAWPKTDFTRTTVDLGEIISGGPPKDGIPAIDRPRFDTIHEADAWLDPREPVIVLTWNERARAYPLQILIYHEIVNDVFEGRPVAVTFCPLCNASLVFDRRLRGRALDFGTTGKLRKSDLVMYDRQTESWWQQFTGKGIVGHYAGASLSPMPSQIVSYEEFRRAHPVGEILSRQTGHVRPYGSNPYRGYDRVGDRPFLFTDPLDPRLPAMERVLGVTHANRHRLYPFSQLGEHGAVNDRLNDLPLVVLYRRDTLSVLDASQIRDSRLIPAATAFDRRMAGRVLEFRVHNGEFIDIQTGTRWNQLGQALEGPLKGQQLSPLEAGVHFAFAWLAFRPDSEIYRSKQQGRQ